MPELHAIAAVSENGIIGQRGRIPWHLPADFAWFKRTTLGGILLMGRKTFESIGRPLPGRETIVLSRSGWTHPAVRVVANPAELDRLLAGETRPIWVCGGAEIYAQWLPRCADLYLTRVRRTVSGDARFPAFENNFTLRGIVLEDPDFQVEHWGRNA